MSDDAALEKAVARFRVNLDYFGRECLMIRTKDSKFVPFKMNAAQRYIHQRLEEQRRKTGMVRAIILKGRQQGCSTYIAARYYRKATLFPDTNVYILAHEQAASDSLFSMVERYHDNNPIAPATGVSNAKELSFKGVRSSYIVGTAGAKAGGRSRTMTLFHGSEVAFWNNAADHFAASVQTIPYSAGTEIILESTANGVSGEYYERWQEAEAGKSDFQAIFVPWFWQPEYRREVDESFELSFEQVDGQISEAEYADMFGLSDEQMAWRRAKINDELRTVSLFDQEYPATSAMAFQTSGEGTYIKTGPVLRARKADIKGDGPLIFGVDPAGEGGDRFVVAMRRGHAVERILYRDKILATEAVDWVDSLIQKYQPALVNVDAGGMGKPVIDFLRAKRQPYGQLVKAVNFGSRSQHKNAKPKVAGPKDRRAEMWERMKEWLDLPEGVSLPDMDALQGDLCSVKIRPNLTNDLQLETKQEMKKRGIRSPDLGDGVALTFADLTFIAHYEGAATGDPFSIIDGNTEEFYDDPEQSWQGF